MNVYKQDAPLSIPPAQECSGSKVTAILLAGVRDYNDLKGDRTDYRITPYNVSSALTADRVLHVKGKSSNQAPKAQQCSSGYVSGAVRIKCSCTFRELAETLAVAQAQVETWQMSQVQQEDQ